MRVVRIFVSSPNDALDERRRVGRVVERLNGAFTDSVRLEAVRWEERFYAAHDGFQPQIPRAGECDIVLAVLRGRIGSPLSSAFHNALPPEEQPPVGQTYPSGTAYEILSAIRARREGRRGELPDVYVFRWPIPPQVTLDAPDRVEIEAQWVALKHFADELFLTSEGCFKGAYQTYNSIDGFEEQIETLLRLWIDAHVLRGRSILWPTQTKRSPFRGLEPFGAKHAQVFFGRDGDRRRAIERLKNAAETGLPVQLVIGPSGAGKSSFVRAGLAPWLTRPGAVAGTGTWRMALMRPAEMADGPVASLAHRLFDAAPDIPDHEAGRPIALPELAFGDYPTPQALASLFARADEASVAPVIRALARAAAADSAAWSGGREEPARLLLVIDQLDELFAAGVPNEERASFAALLSALARTGQVWLVATLRAEFFEAFLKSPLAGLVDDERTYTLRPPGLSEMAEIVRAPAAAAGLVYELDLATGEHLDERLLRDIDRPDLLPLLQFVLERLYEQREGGTDDEPVRLTHAAYERMGTLDGAIDQAAGAALATLGEAEQKQLPRLLRTLVTPAGVKAGEAMTGGLTWTLRSQPLAQAAPDVATLHLVQALVDARVLITGDDACGQATIGLAHQRVIEAWGQARAIVAGSADFYRVQIDLTAQRRRWEEGRRRTELLIPRGLSLAEAEQLVADYQGEISSNDAAFVRASRRRANRAVTVVSAAAALFAVIALLAVAASWYAGQQRKEAERQAQTARTQQAIAEVQTRIADQERNRAVSAEGDAAQQRDEAERQKTVAEEQARQAKRQSDRSEARAELIQAQLMVGAAPEEALSRGYSASSRLRSLGSIDDVSPFLNNILKSVRALTGLRPYAHYSLNSPTVITTQDTTGKDGDNPLTVIGTGDITGVVDDAGRAAGAPIGGPNIDGSTTNDAAWLGARQFILATGAWSRTDGAVGPRTTNAALRLHNIDGTVATTYLDGHDAPITSVAVLNRGQEDQVILAGDEAGNVIIVGRSAPPRVIPSGVRAPIARIFARGSVGAAIVFGPHDPERESTKETVSDDDLARQKSLIAAAIGQDQTLGYIGAERAAHTGCAAPMIDRDYFNKLYICDRNTVKLFNTFEFDKDRVEPDRTFTAHAQTVTAIAVARAAPIIATGSEDGEIRLWLSDGRLLSDIATGETNRITALGFTDGGRTLISGSIRGLRRWDVSDLAAQFGDASAGATDASAVSAALRDSWVSFSDPLYRVLRKNRAKLDQLLSKGSFGADEIATIRRDVVAGAPTALILIDTSTWAIRSVALPDLSYVKGHNPRVAIAADTERTICVLRRPDDFDAREYTVTAVDAETASVKADWQSLPRTEGIPDISVNIFNNESTCWIKFRDTLIILDPLSNKRYYVHVPRNTNVTVENYIPVAGGTAIAFSRYIPLEGKSEILLGEVSQESAQPGTSDLENTDVTHRLDPRVSTTLNGRIHSIAVSRDGQRFAVAISKKDTDDAVSEVRILDKTLNTLFVLPGMVQNFDRMSFSLNASSLRATIKNSNYIYEQDIQVEPLFDTAKRRVDAIELENRHRAFEQAVSAEKDWSKSRLILSSALVKYPYDPTFILILANRYFYTSSNWRDRVKAMLLYDKGVSIDPYNVMNYYMRGKAFALLEQDRRAVEDFAMAAQLPHILPIVPVVRGNLGINQGINKLSLQLNRQSMAEIVFRHLYSSSRIGQWDNVQRDAAWLRVRGLGFVLSEALDAEAHDVAGDREGALFGYVSTLAKVASGAAFGVEEFNYGKTDPVLKSMNLAIYERRSAELADLLGKPDQAERAYNQSKSIVQDLLSNMADDHSTWPRARVVTFLDQIKRIISDRIRPISCFEKLHPQTIQTRDATIMTFVNRSNVPVSLHRYDIDGTKIFVRTVGTGERIEQSSFQTQPWVIEGPSGDCRHIYVSVTANQEVIIP